MITDRESHNMLHQAFFNCYKCGKSFSSEKEVITHLKLIHNACATPDCRKIADFKMHSSVCDNRGFGCPVCNEKFSEKYALQIHFNEHIGVAFHVCEICRDGFQQRKDLQRHLLNIHQKNVSVPVTPSLSKAVFQQCVQCCKYFKLFSEFEEHKSLCSSMPNSCDTCQVIFASSSCLENHRHLEHKDSLSVRGYLAFTNGKRYFCGICYLGFFKGDILKKHLQTHNTEEFFMCDVCYSGFSNDEALQEHYLQHIEEHYILHDVIKHHSCISCRRTFKTQKLLENHLVSDFCRKETLQNNSNLIGMFSNNGIISDVKNIEKTDNLEIITMDTNQTNESLLNSENIVSKENVSDTKPECCIFDISDVPVYVFKSGEELLNCDDGDCVVVIDKKCLFVLQKGVCASENRVPDLSNYEIFPEDDNNIDTSLLVDHMLQIIKPIEKDRYAEVEHRNNAEISEGDALCVGSTDTKCNSNSDTVNSKASGNSFTDMLCHSNSEISDKTLCDQNFTPVYEASETVTLSCSDIDSNTVEEIYESAMYSACVKDVSKVIVSEDKWMDQETLSSDGKSDEICKKGYRIETTSCVQTYVCNICHQVFSSETSLCLHMKGSHIGFDSYQCGLSFSKDDKLLLRENISHHSSLHCDKREGPYPKEHSLKKHKHNAHGGKHFLCHICDKSFVLKNEYREHVMHHTDDDPPSKCDICGKVYMNITNFKRHRSLHEGRSLKKRVFL